MGTRRRRAIKAALHLSRRVEMKFSELPVGSFFKGTIQQRAAVVVFKNTLLRKISARKCMVVSTGEEFVITHPSISVVTALARYAGHLTPQSYLSAGLLCGNFRGKSLQGMKRSRRYVIGHSSSELVHLKKSQKMVNDHFNGGASSGCYYV